MEYVDHIKQRFPETTAFYDTIGSDRENGIVGCGFIWKNTPQQNNIDSVFTYYSGVLLIDGSGRYIDEEGVSTVLYPGCYVQRIPGRRHSTIVNLDGKWIEVFLCLGRGLYEALARIGLIKTDKPVLYTGLDRILLERFITLYDELKRPDFFRYTDYLIRVQEIIFLAHELDMKNSGDDALPLIEQACRLIELNIMENPNARDIARKLNVSYESFRKLFKARKGISPHEYIIRKRVDTAKTMLLQKKDISDIAAELGYCDSFAFSKQFKKISGVSPSRFRYSN